MEDNITIDFFCKMNVTYGCRTAMDYGQDYKHFKIAFEIYIAVFLIVLGLVGNLMSFLVLGYDKTTNTSLLLRALALADSAFLLTCLLFQTFNCLYLYMDAFAKTLLYFPYVMIYIWPLAATTQTTAVWFVVMVSVDRYLAICHPLHSKQMMTRRKIWLAIFSVIAAACIFNLPVWFDLEPIDRRQCCPQINTVEARPSDLMRSSLYQLIYKTISCFIFRAGLPLIILIVLNYKLCHAVHKSRKSVMRYPHEEPRKTNTNALIIGVISIFILCELPDFFFRILRTIKFYEGEIRISWEGLAYFGTVTNTFLTLNSAVNFLVYCVTGKRFRHRLATMLHYSAEERKQRPSIPTEETSLSQHRPKPSDSMHSR